MIVQCEECGKEISSEAAACPSCGFPKKTASTGETPTSGSQIHIYGWIAVVAFVMSNFIPAIIATFLVMIAVIFALLELKQGSKTFGVIALALSLLQAWFVADHFANISATIGITNPEKIQQQAAQKFENISLEVPSDAFQTIQQFCSDKWPSDFQMRKYCQDQQQEAVKSLKNNPPPLIDNEAFRVIRGKCSTKWPRDFQMRAYCESQQYDSYKALKISNAGDAARARCAQKWPDDYQMQKYCEEH